jgi:hypothetical protein
MARLDLTRDLCQTRDVADQGNRCHINNEMKDNGARSNRRNLGFVEPRFWTQAALVWM